MKRNDKLNNNKGAALISVMIAVTFVTIVASALLYMAYMNFTMKTMSVQSKVNFYETEGYLQGVTVKVQDEISRSTDPSAYIDTLRTGTNQYDCSKFIDILATKYPTTYTDGPAKTGDAASCTYHLSPTDEVVIKRGEGAKYSESPMPGSSKTTICKFENMIIQQNTKDGLTNNIKTDLVYYVSKEATSADAGGVGEFSMMLDGALTSDASNFPSLTMYGNCFLSSTYMCSESKTAPGLYDGDGGAALKLAGTSKYNIVGKYCVIYGDVWLTQSSILTISKDCNLTVYGDIHLDDNSSLICNGNIYMVDGVIYGRAEKTGIYTNNGTLENHLYPSDLVTKPVSLANFTTFAEELEYDDDDMTNDGLLNHILKPEGASNGVHYYDIKDETNVDPVDIDGRMIGWKAFGSKQVISEGNASNRLCFVYDPNTTIDHSQINSTIISKYSVKYNTTEHGIVLSKIGPEAFKVLNLKSTTDSSSPFYNSTIHEMEVSTLSNTYNMSAGDFFVDDPDSVVNKILGLSVNNEGGSPQIISSVKFDNWVKDVMLNN